MDSELSEDEYSREDPRGDFLRALGALGGLQLAEVMQRLGLSDLEIDGLIDNLIGRGEPFLVLELLNELSERLLMMNGITAERVIPALRLAKALVDILNEPALEEDLELQMMCCRCLYNFLEVNQDFVHDALTHHAVTALCTKLQQVQYIDLTEQTLQTLEMMLSDPLSHGEILSSGGLACLNYLDFLTTHAQRKCLSIVANACTAVVAHHFETIATAMPQIEAAVHHSDSQVAQLAWRAISRLVALFRGESLQKLMPPLLPAMMATMASLSQVLTLLEICARTPELALAMLEAGVGLEMGKDPRYLELIYTLLPGDAGRAKVCQAAGRSYQMFVIAIWPLLVDALAMDPEIRRRGLECVLRVLEYGYTVPQQDLELLVKLVAAECDQLLAWVALALLERVPELVECFDRQGFFLNLPGDEQTVQRLVAFAPERSPEVLDHVRQMFAAGKWVDLLAVLSYELLEFVPQLLQIDIPEVAIASLVAKLHDALERVEPFELIYALRDLAKQIRLRLTTLLLTMMLSVHAIATFATVEAYLSLINVGPIDFIINGAVVPKDLTIFGAIYRSLQTLEDEVVEPIRLYGVHDVKLLRAGEKLDEVLSLTLPRTQDSRMLIRAEGDVGDYNATTSIDANTSLDTSVDESITEVAPSARSPTPLARDEPTSTKRTELQLGDPLANKKELTSQRDAPHIAVLQLLRRLYQFHCIPDSAFVNAKLTRKMNRQLEEPLVVALTLPGWMFSLMQYPFLFPVESRLLFLQLTLFGYLRLIHHWQLRTHQQENKLGRPTRQKVRISRKTMFQSAIKVLEMYGLTPGILEIEYFDEVGLGLGPTLEFYSTVSQEFSRLPIWRSDSPTLFPAPRADAKTLFLMHALGKFVGRAMLDLRIVDFNFNPAFFQLLSGDISIEQVDEKLAMSLDCLDPGAVGDLDIFFTLPGYDDIELIPNGAALKVTAENFEKYKNLVIAKTINVRPHINLFAAGFSTVFPIELMNIFTAYELIELFGNAEEDWLEQTLTAAIHANHGYGADSPAILRMIEILGEFTTAQRRAFLQFLTGSPKLPIGGFKALRPELTVVRKHPDSGSADNYLPSVMTCANYLKLPNYSSKEIMKRKILQAIHDGANAFHLS